MAYDIQFLKNRWWKRSMSPALSLFLPHRPYPSVCLYLF